VDIETTTPHGRVGFLVRRSPVRSGAHGIPCL